MGNEEKILQALAELKAGQDELRTGQADLRADLNRLNQTVAKIEVEHGRKLDALYDGYQDVSRKVDAVKTTADGLAETVTALDVYHRLQRHG